ncbi:MAG: winged helix-turn-helix domain-containing protein [Pseudohongiellaceae bacterium]
MNSHARIIESQNGPVIGYRDERRMNDPRAPLVTDFHVGCWLVQPSLNRVSRSDGSGSNHTLEPRLMHLLCYLGANPQRVLSREQLSNQLWPRVVVNENSLTRAISELRGKLDTPEVAGREYIDTVSKRGYRLTLPVKSSATPADISRRLTAVPGWTGIHAVRRLGLALAGGATAWVLIMLIDPRLNTTGPQFEPVVALPVLEDRIVGPISGQSGSRPVSRHIATDVAKAEMEAERPALSKDGSKMAYITYDKGVSTVFLSRFAPQQTPWPVYRTTDYLSNLSWSPVGNAVLFAREPVFAPAVLFSGTSHSELVMLDLDTMETRVLLQSGSESNTDSKDGMKLT